MYGAVFVDLPKLEKTNIFVIQVFSFYLTPIFKSNLKIDIKLKLCTPALNNGPLIVSIQFKNQTREHHFL